MNIKSTKSSSSNYPKKLLNIASTPKQLFTLGEPLSTEFSIAVVGSRKVSSYGRFATETLIAELAKLGVTIISGLALGVDGLSHKAALSVKGRTIAVMPCGLDQIYPASHRGLAKQILKEGGTLVSEYDLNTPPLKQHFPARNRIVSGLADAVLIIEAAEKSGSLITAGFALEQGKTVMAVPGNINSPLSAGTNNLIKTGAHPITNVRDILEVCGKTDLAASTKDIRGDNAQEQAIIDVLIKGPRPGDELQKESKLSAGDYNQTITMLELKSILKSQGSNIWSL